MSRTAVCILNFHGIGTPHDGVDASEAPYWVSRDRFCEILDLAKASDSKVMVTFDDGNISDVEIGLPELLARKMKGSFFVLAGRINDPRYLSPDDISALQEAGMTIGLHGRDHVNWRQVDETTLQDETVTSRAEIAQITGGPIDTVGIPFGAYDKRVIGQLKKQGFREIYTSDGGHTSEHRRLRHRTSIRCDMGMEEIKRILAGQESLAIKTKRQLKTLLKEYIVG